MTTFEQLGLEEPILSTLAQMGFMEPTPVQEKVIPHLLKNTSDIIALAQTGTGKTAAFGLPMVSLFEASSKKVQGLILCPTRELCIQVSKDLENYGKAIGGLKICSVYGGASIDQQIRDIQKGAQIIVATPGRLLDIIRRKKINLNEISYMVLDEADEMLNMGFKEDMESILAETPAEKFVWLFSATMPADIHRLTKKYMNNPVEISVGSKNQGNENIEHVYYELANKYKYNALRRVCDSNPDIFGMVFCRTKREVQEVAEQLIKDGYPADALHGDLSQAQRDVVMKRFRQASIQILVATDVAARGIDVNDVTHVIHYQLPDEPEAYTHRSGRTARAGKKGISVVFLSKKDLSKLKNIERISKIKFTQENLPDVKDVIAKQINTRVQALVETEVSEEVQAIWEQLNLTYPDLTTDVLLQKFLSKEIHKLLSHYKKNDNPTDSSESIDFSDNEEEVMDLFVNIGKVDDFDNFSFKDFLRENAGLTRKELRWVEMKGTYSFIEVESSGVEKLMATFQGAMINDRKINIEVRGVVNRRKPKSNNDRPKRGFHDKKSGSFGGQKSYSKGGSRGGGERGSRRY